MIIISHQLPSVVTSLYLDLFPNTEISRRKQNQRQGGEGFNIYSLSCIERKESHPWIQYALGGWDEPFGQHYPLSVLLHVSVRWWGKDTTEIL